MKHLTLLIVALFSLLSLNAGAITFDSNTKYYITCNQNTQGYVCLGASQNKSYPLYYTTSAATPTTDDGYWYITQNGDYYAFKNASSGEYLCFSSDYSSDRYLNTSATLSDEAYWTLTDYNGSYYVYNKAQSSFYWNLRTGTYQLGTYATNSPNGGSNSLFNFVEAEDSESGGESGGESSDDIVYLGAPTTAIEYDKYYVLHNGGHDAYLFTQNTYSTSSGSGYRPGGSYTTYYPIYAIPTSNVTIDGQKFSDVAQYLVKFVKNDDSSVYIQSAWNNEYYGQLVSGSNYGTTSSATKYYSYGIVNGETDWFWFYNDNDGYYMDCNNPADQSTGIATMAGWTDLATSQTSNAAWQCIEVTFDTPTPATAISLNKTSLNMSMGQSYQLVASVIPEEASNALRWTSSDPSVASVNGGLIRALAEGTTTITVASSYNASVKASCSVRVYDPDKGEYLAHGSDCFFLQMIADSALIVIPKDLTTDHAFDNNVFTATLASGETITYDRVLQVTDACPYPMPSFKSYKFNNKFNYQLFTDVIAPDPTASEINLSVGGIGKRLTPSFQLDSKRMEVWVGDTLQDSKHTRMRFDHPITYNISYNNWRRLEILHLADDSYRNIFKPYGKQTVVTVDWLTDHSSNEYNVPEIHITVDDGSNITDKTTLKDAHIEITGGGVYPDMASMAVQIKGRGNTSWGGYGSKNPYRLKFASKQKPLGMTKGKSWILLANKQTGSMTTNAIGQKIASLMDSDFPCHIVPVELYINGYYQGSYNFCEKVGLSNNNVSLDDDTNAAMMELDTYSDEGETPNKLNAYGMNVKINDPNVEDATYTGPLTWDGVFSDFNFMTQQVANGGESYTNYVAKKSLVSYLATCELMCNCEMKHPKSIFCYSEDVTDGLDPTGEDPTKWHFGPLWDCDWAFGYEQNYNYYQVNQAEDFYANLIGSGSTKTFWNALRYNSSAVDSLYFNRWYEFMNEGGLDELIEFCDDYYDFAAPSLSHNNDGQFARDYTDYSTVTTNCKSWLKARSENIYAAITHYALPQTTTPEPGDINGDGLFLIDDMAHLVAIMLGLEPDTYGVADLNGDGIVNAMDAALLSTKIRQ